MATAEARVIDPKKQLAVNRAAGMLCCGTAIAMSFMHMSCTAKLNSVNGVGLPVVCRGYKPITWVDSDSQKTKEQIIVHNKTWEKHCKQ